jgi:hypothetical protein
MNALEIGRDARAALAAATRWNVVMTFSRGEVVETDRGEIVWFDSDPEAFSPKGVLTAMHRGGQAPAPVAAKGRDLGQAGATALHNAFVDACSRFLEALARTSLAEASPILLGLGPGLTPSGDDYLGGFLATLHHLGRPATIDTANTHAISRARLAMHMRGEGTRAEVRFVRALVRGEQTMDAEAALLRHGHSSGDDFIRGARAAWSLR